MHVTTQNLEAQENECIHSSLILSSLQFLNMNHRSSKPL